MNNTCPNFIDLIVIVEFITVNLLSFTIGSVCTYTIVTARRSCMCTCGVKEQVNGKDQCLTALQSRRALGDSMMACLGDGTSISAAEA